MIDFISQSENAQCASTFDRIQLLTNFYAALPQWSICGVRGLKRSSHNYTQMQNQIQTDKYRYTNTTFDKLLCSLCGVNSLQKVFYSLNFKNPILKNTARPSNVWGQQMLDHRVGAKYPEYCSLQYK